ncbi:RNA-directed DNA polymerase, eukaryota, reverse transcriptase zinc-binding domain protein [Tanacetum coccineum]
MFQQSFRSESYDCYRDISGKFVRSGCTTTLNIVPWETDGESVLREACPRASFLDLLLLSLFIVQSACLLLLPHYEIGRSSGIDDEVVQDQRQRDDNDLQDERQDQPRKKRLNLEEAKGQELRNRLDPILFLLWSKMNLLLIEKRPSMGSMVVFLMAQSISQISAVLEDFWHGTLPLKSVYPRVYLLESERNSNVANRISLLDWSQVLRRHPRGGIEATKFADLKRQIGDVVLSDHNDAWVWSPNTSKGFSVASARSLIDSHILDVSHIATRWNGCIPIKVNIFLWKLLLNKLPSRVNLDRRGIDIPSILCPICQEDVETANHLFFTCEMASTLWSMLANWWEVDIPLCANMEDWTSWLDNSHLPKKVRVFLDGVSLRNELKYVQSGVKMNEISCLKVRHVEHKIWETRTIPHRPKCEVGMEKRTPNKPYTAAFEQSFQQYRRSETLVFSGDLSGKLSSPAVQQLWTLYPGKQTGNLF